MLYEQKTENGKTVLMVHPMCGEQESREFWQAVQELKRENAGEVRVICVKEKKQPRFTMYKTPIYSKRG